MGTRQPAEGQRKRKDCQWAIGKEGQANGKQDKGEWEQAKGQ